MKFAAMEGLYTGSEKAHLVVFGILGSTKKMNGLDETEFLIKLDIPNLLSVLAFQDPNAFVPGVKDLVNGNNDRNIISFNEKIKKGKLAIESLAAYKTAKDSGKIDQAKVFLGTFRDNFKYFGYGYYFGKDINMLVPSVPISFYSFHIMVILGSYFLLLFVVVLFLTMQDKIEKKRWLLWLSLFTIPLAYIASESGWVLAEVGRQPWVIQDLMPNIAAVSKIDSSSVQITFFLFLVLFTSLLIAEIKIMLTQIKKGPALPVIDNSQTK
jgi:cytochrome d ubiquinol oxidase subunit I